MKTKISKLSLLSAAIATLYWVYLMYYFFGGGTGGLAGAIAGGIVSPHIFFVLVGVILNWVGTFAKNSWCVLIGAILYCIAALLMFIYAIFLVLPIIFSFVAFALMHKKQSVPPAPPMP